MTLYGWAFFAGFCAVLAEYIFRTYGHVGFWKLELIVFPLQILIGLGVYKIFTGAEFFLLGAVIFPFGTATMRLIAQLFIFDESPNIKVYLAFGFICMAQIVRLLPWRDG